MTHVSTFADREQLPDAIGRPFIKMHGLRNHFVIVDGRETPFAPPQEEIARICDVETGVGAHQLLVIEKPTKEGLTAGAYAFMRLYNIDGKESGACGNATRCVAYLLLEESGAETVFLETVAGVLECGRAGDLSVSVDMGPITMDWEKIPTARAIDTHHLDLNSGPLSDATVANIGTPHAVFFVDDLQSVDVPRFAPAIQDNPLFPKGINVGVAQMVSETALRLVVWERPGVLTAACGTGSCVAAYAARVRGLTKASNMTVEMPGGVLEIQLTEHDTAIMTGPVAFSYRGTL